MVSSKNLTETEMIEAFGKPLADRVRLLTFSTDAVLDEFNHKGRTYLGGYDYYRKNYYILTADSPVTARQRQGGTIITIRTKQENKTHIHRLQTVHN